LSENAALLIETTALKDKIQELEETLENMQARVDELCKAGFYHPEHLSTQETGNASMTFLIGSLLKRCYLQDSPLMIYIQDSSLDILLCEICGAVGNIVASQGRKFCRRW
jgi:hypothetical protein